MNVPNPIVGAGVDNGGSLSVKDVYLGLTLFSPEFDAHVEFCNFIFGSQG